MPMLPDRLGPRQRRGKRPSPSTTTRQTPVLRRRDPLDGSQSARRRLGHSSPKNSAGPSIIGRQIDNYGWHKTMAGAPLRESLHYVAS